MKQPFVAAVGVETASQYREIARADLDLRLGEIAVGVLMSEKTGLRNEANRHGPVYPTFEDTAAIMTASEAFDVPHVPVIVHYNTDHPQQAGDQMVQALRSYTKVDAVQVNNLGIEDLPNLVSFRTIRPEIDIIVQINAALLSEYRLRPDELAEKLAEHKAVIDYAWLDGSGGLGRMLDVRALIPFVESIEKRGIGVGIAGGLRSDNIENTLLSLLEQYSSPDLAHPIPISWDAQSGVMTKVGNIRRFDTQQAIEFYRNSLELRRRIGRLVQ